MAFVSVLKLPNNAGLSGMDRLRSSDRLGLFR
jgi:hypothetical protein